MSSAKRIAIYTSSFPPKSGGIAAAHFNLFQQFSKDHDVKAFVFRDGGESEERVVRGVPYPGIERVFRLGLRKLLRKPIAKPLNNCDRIAETAASVFCMNKQLRRFDPHLIICPDHYLPALALKKPPGAKLAWMARHNYLRFAEQWLCPPIDFDDLHLAHRLERRAIKKADMLVSPSRYMCDLFQSHFGSELPSYVAKNFVQKDHLQSVSPAGLREQMGIGEELPIVYIPSGGSMVKGSRFTVEIVRRLARQKSIAVYIPGNMTPMMRRELENLCQGAVVFAPGKVPYNDNLANVAACDLTVSPTLVENLSNALVESIMLGIPVVTFDTGGNKEIIHCGKTGHVVPYADVEALIQQAAGLLADNGKLQSLRGVCATEASKIVNQDEITATYEALLTSL